MIIKEKSQDTIQKSIERINIFGYITNKVMLRFIVMLVLLYVMNGLLISDNFIVFGQSESMAEEMTAELSEKGDGNLISSLSEWIGIFSIGIIVGLLAFKIDTSYNLPIREIKRIIISIAVLSISIGLIHLLLVQEHSKESFWWGVIFFVSGIAQIGFGTIILLVQKNQINIILYYIGIIGNTILIIAFIAVRLVTPPFSPEDTPIKELEPNGIITLIIETLTVILLIYVTKFEEEARRIIK